VNKRAAPPYAPAPYTYAGVCKRVSEKPSGDSGSASSVSRGKVASGVWHQGPVAVHLIVRSALARFVCATIGSGLLQPPLARTIHDRSGVYAQPGTSYRPISASPFPMRIPLKGFHPLQCLGDSRLERRSLLNDNGGLWLGGRVVAVGVLSSCTYLVEPLPQKGAFPDGKVPSAGVYHPLSGSPLTDNTSGR